MAHASPTNNGVAQAQCLGGCVDFAFSIEASQKRIHEPPSALYEHYLHKNIYPSLLEATTIKADLREATSTVSVITDAVARLKAKIDALEEEKIHINEFKDTSEQVKSEAHTGQIGLYRGFEHYRLHHTAGGRDLNVAPSSLDSRYPPWSLAQVCQSFRNLALATPSLWSFISLGIPGAHNTGDADSLARMRAHEHLLRVQLQRSHDHPLTIITYMPENTMSSMDRSLPLLCTHTHRWRSLRLELNEAAAGELSHIRGSLPWLESLDIHCLGPGFGGELDFLEFAPQLKKLVLSGDRGLPRDDAHSWGSSPGALKLPTTQITDYCHYGHDDDHNGVGADSESSVVYRLLVEQNHLSRLQGLTKLVLFFNSRSISIYHHLRGLKETDDWASRLRFKWLTELELRSYHPEEPVGIDEMLYWIVAPSVTKLTVSTSGGDRTALHRFLLQPDTLTSLTIHRVRMSSEEFFAVLSRLAFLRDLAFGVEGGINTSYLSLFKPSESPTNSFRVVPELQSLALLPVPGSQSYYSDDILLEILEARWRPSSTSESSALPRLQSIQLDRVMENESMIARLTQLREEGLRVLGL
ncbi:hypothetical protein PQX77_002911 [Marasmius sp. AFHP31]|nr:hypothetical protein PQX77_002911 [Marasmius sp. AFHP31]